MKSSDEYVATVDENGLVTANNIGEAVITVTVMDVLEEKVFSAQCTVKVKSRNKVIFHNNFETEDQLDSWNINYGDASNTVTITEENGNHVVEMNRASSQGTALQAIKILDETITGKVIIEARIKGGTGPNANTKTRVLYVRNDKNQNVIGIALNWNKKMCYSQYEGTSVKWYEVTDYQGGTWYKVTIDFDTATGKYDLYIDDILYGTYDIMAGTDPNAASIVFSLHNANPDVFFFDDVSVSVPAQPAESVSLPETTTVMVGDELQLIPEIEPDGANVTMEWESLNVDVATVDQTGKVTPVKPGTAVIRVIVREELYGNEFTAQCSVLVEPRSYTLYLEDFEGVETGSLPGDWIIANKDTVDTIAVGEDNGSKVLIMNRHASSTKAVSVYKDFSGETGMLTVETRVKPVKNNKTHVIYIKNTNGEDLIRFFLYQDRTLRINGYGDANKTGAMYNVGAWNVFRFNIDTTKGTADFYCNGVFVGTYETMTDSCNLGRVQYNMHNQTDVTMYIDYLKVSLSPAVSIPEEFILKPGETAVLPVEYAPEDIDEIIWKSDDPDVAEVDSDGRVTAKGAGKATIRVTVNSGTYGTAFAECEVTVTAPIAGVSITPSEATLSVGEELQLSFVTSPDGVAFDRAEWASGNTDVAVVDDSGKVTALSEGQADITVTVFQADMQVSDTITVTVEDADEPVVPVTGISIEAPVTEVRAGGTIQLTAVTTPDNATFKGVIWTSGNPDVATVDENGVVTGMTSGEAIITATIIQPEEYGVVSDSIVITVTEEEEPGEDPGEEPGEDPGEEPGDGGGSDPTPTPTSTPTPEPEDLNDKIETVTETDGTRTSRLPENALEDLEEVLNNDDTVVITVGNGARSQRFEAPAEMLELIGEGKSVELNYGNVRMSIPANVADVDTLKAKLGVSSLEEVTVSLEVKQTTCTDTGDEFGTPVKVFEFRFTAGTEDGRIYEISEFMNPVTVRIPVGESVQEPVIKGTRNLYRVDVDPPEYRYTYRDGNDYVAELAGFSTYALMDYIKEFDDVKAGHWAHNYVQAAAAKK